MVWHFLGLQVNHSQRFVPGGRALRYVRAWSPLLTFLVCAGDVSAGRSSGRSYQVRQLRKSRKSCFPMWCQACLSMPYSTSMDSTESSYAVRGCILASASRGRSCRACLGVSGYRGSWGRRGKASIYYNCKEHVKLPHPVYFLPERSAFWNEKAAFPQWRDWDDNTTSSGMMLPAG